MTLRLKITLAFIAAALMGVVLSFVLAAMLPNMALAARSPRSCRRWSLAALAMSLAARLRGRVTDLEGVILRFIKWDMDGIVPHAARADEVGEYRQGAEGLPDRRHPLEREPQERAGQPSAACGSLRSSGPRS